MLFYLLFYIKWVKCRLLMMYMRYETMKQSWKLEIISKILWIKKETLKQKLWRAWTNINDTEFIKELIINKW